MISEKEYMELNIGDIVENKGNPDLFLIIFKGKTYSDREMITLFNLHSSTFASSFKEDFKNNFFKVDKKKEIDPANPANEIINSLIFNFIKYLKNNKDAYDEIINNKNIKISKEILDMFTDENNIEKLVIDTRTNKKYSMMELETIEGLNYVKLFRRNIISVGKMELESLYVPRYEFTKYFENYKDEVENEEMNNFYNKECELKENCESVSFIDSDRSAFEEKSVFQKINEERKIRQDKSKVIKSFNLVRLDYDENNEDKIEVFDINRFVKFLEKIDDNELDKMKYKLGNYKEILLEQEKHNRILKINSIYELKEEMEKISDGFVFTNPKIGETYAMLSPIMDLFTVKNIIDNRIYGTYRTSIKLENGTDYIYMLKQDISMHKNMFERLVAFVNNEESNKLIPNPYNILRIKNSVKMGKTYNLSNNKIINIKDIEETDFQELKLIEKEGLIHYVYDYIPLNEVSEMLVEEIADKETKDIYYKEKNDFLIEGKNLIFYITDEERINLMIYKINRQYVYLKVKPFNYNCDIVVRLPKKLLIKNRNLFHNSYMFGTL